MRLTIKLLLVWFGVLATGGALGSDLVTVVDTSGRKRADGILTEWSNDRIVVRTDTTHGTPLDELLTLNFDRVSVPLAGGDPLVILANGDRLVLRPVGIFEDVLTATWHKIASRPAIKLPLETIAAIVLDLPAASDDRLRMYSQLQTLPPGDDIVLLVNGDRVEGEIERLDGAFVQLKSATGQLKLDRTRVRAIRMNPELTSIPKSSDRRLVLSLRDGSRFTAGRVELRERELKCTTIAKQEFQISLADCVGCQAYGARAVPLTDRKPEQFYFTPYLSTPWPLVENSNVLRGPLTLRGVEYGTGLGVHSRSLVTYSLQPTDREFRATVGIDDCAGGAGSVRFAVELDGRRVWDSSELTGRSLPVQLPPLKLDGAAKLTLIVDFGAHADVADYANWCDAVVIRD